MTGSSKHWSVKYGGQSVRRHKTTITVNNQTENDDDSKMLIFVTIAHLDDKQPRNFAQNSDLILFIVYFGVKTLITATKFQFKPKCINLKAKCVIFLQLLNWKLSDHTFVSEKHF